MTEEGEKVTIDDFLMDVAITLGVSQKVVENEYYMIDLPELMEKKRRKDAIDRLHKLLLYNASNMEQSEFKKFVTELMRQAGIKEETKFSREKIEQLRAMMKGF